MLIFLLYFHKNINIRFIFPSHIQIGFELQTIFYELLKCVFYFSISYSDWIRAIGRSIVIVKNKKFIRDDGSEID